MAIIYINHATGFTKAYPDLHEPERLVLYDLVLERGRASAFDRIRSLDPALRNASCLVLRGRTRRFIEQLIDEPLLFQVLPPSLPVIALVGSDVDGDVKFVTDAPFRTPGFQPSIQSCCEAEIRTILDRNRCCLGPYDGIHYQLPSGDHSEAFIRLSPAFHDQVDLLRLVDWIMPSLGPRVGVVADNGSMQPLVLATCLEAYRLYGWVIPYRTIDSYALDPAVLLGAVTDLVTEMGPDGSILFLISVNASGRLVSAILKQRVPVPHSIKIICSTSDVAQPDEALTSLPIRRWPANTTGECPECATRDLWVIDERLYEHTVNPKRVGVSISHTAAAKHRDFWAAADRTDAVKLHFDLVSEEGANRHYSIFIDHTALLTDGWFRSIALGRLRDLRKPTVCITPKHAGTRAIQQLVQEAYGAVELYELARGRVPEDVYHRLQALTDRDHILIADDALVSCTTLYNLRPEVQALYKHQASMPEISGFVVLARPAQPGDLKNLGNRYRDGKGIRLTAAYECLMPSFQECPWCREREFLTNSLKGLTGAGLDAAQARIKKLTGRFEPPFLLGAADSDRDARSLGSFFGELRPAAAFAAAASSIHEQWEYRAGETQKGRPSTIYFVDVARLINNLFADSFVPAVFRTMTPKKINFGAQRAAIMEGLQPINPSKIFPCLLQEFLWAVVEGKLPPEAAPLLRPGYVGGDEGPELEMLCQLLPSRG